MIVQYKEIENIYSLNLWKPILGGLSSSWEQDTSSSIYFKQLEGDRDWREWRLFECDMCDMCFQVSSITAMSTPPNNERSPRKWFKQKFRSVFSSSRSSSRSLEGQSTGTNVPPLNSPFDSDGPRIIADRTGSGKKIGLIHKFKGFNTLCSKNYLTWSPLCLLALLHPWMLRRVPVRHH